ncbi:MAG TPA: ribosome biogenesis GTP-binding protein YihA/YsxC [Kofleriaceae bacterium]|nr:ribosome biogenesis GTP-binding protein YihA/YsxC [Kofleriaceae bacterium]
MKAPRAEFLTSASDPGGFPRPELPEIAIAGRSNVGKSSLINMLVGVPGLARTSRTPGRTRLLNWFRVEPVKGPALALVDLPGYGFAKVSRDLREAWRPLVEAYLTGRREALRAVVLLVDARRGGEDEERELIEYLAEQEVPVQVVLTKSDKLGKAQRRPAAAAVRRQLGLARDPILCSASTAEGMDLLWRFLLDRAARPRSE